jgi:hypothetical protein
VARERVRSQLEQRGRVEHLARGGLQREHLGPSAEAVSLVPIALLQLDRPPYVHRVDALQRVCVQNLDPARCRRQTEPRLDRPHAEGHRAANQVHVRKVVRRHAAQRLEHLPPSLPRFFGLDVAQGLDGCVRVLKHGFDRRRQRLERLEQRRQRAQQLRIERPTADRNCDRNVAHQQRDGLVGLVRALILGQSFVALLGAHERRHQALAGVVRRR